ncbi:ankyrin [Annulohypoxylon truncatum]|uniref:ankyrin n=1 Tax=Annulohypoxylon truncatum TaxID=327061 RepID=UPI002007B61B|nr:ankyrin [Annulohypoxylon truncatum]KAI1209261.1 ankyrin [Annulohypoxylon truncatum]
MADPLSISASIAGLITLADVVFLRLMKYVRSAKNAEKEIEDLTKEINTLGGTLHSLSTLAQCFGDKPVENRTFRMYHIEACNDILASIHKKLKKFDSDSLTKKARWPFTSTRVHEFLDELSRHKQSINLALAANSMDLLLRSLAREEDLQKTASELQASVEKTKEIVSRIHRNEEHGKIESFFLRHNPQQNYEMSLKLRQPRTGLWLLRLPNFQTWLSTPDEKIWLSGIPGAGKTVLAGTIIEASLAKCNDSMAGAFFFCDYKAEKTHSPANILGSLAYQIAIQKKEAYQTLEQYYRDLHPSNSLSRDYTIGGLERALRDMIKLFDRVFITVDGIDECGQSVEEVLDILCAISKDSDNISMALLSRDEHNIRDRLENDFVCEKVAAHTEDITEYVTAQIEKRMRIRKLRIDDLELKGEIMQGLIDGAAGMFRWVACQLDHLEQCDSDQECREALKKLPPNLNETYLRILDRISTNKARCAQLILHFIAFADPGLTIQQLREVVSVPEAGGFLKSSGVIHESSIQRLCSSLVRKSNDKRRFEFAHFSVKEFLENEAILQGKFSQFLISKSRCNRLMTIQCLKYMQLENFNHIPAATMDEFSYMQKRNRNNPFYAYAAKQWLLYAINEWVDEEIIHLAKKLFSRGKTAFFSSWIVEIMIHNSNVSEEKTMESITEVNYRCFTPFHVACAMSLPIICSHLLDEGVDIDQESPIGTPLQCAAGSLVSDKAFVYYIFGEYIRRVAPTSASQTINSLLKAGVNRFGIASSFGKNKRPLEIALEASQFNINFSVITLLLLERFTLYEIDIKTLESVLSKCHFSEDFDTGTLEITVKQFVMTLNSMIEFSPLHRKLCSVVWDYAVDQEMSFISDLYLVDISISLSPDMQKQHLIQAVRDGDVAMFERTQKDSGLNASEILDEDGDPLIYSAMYYHRSLKNCPMIETLLKVGCSFFQSGRDGLLPIHKWLHVDTEPDEELFIQSLVKVFIDQGVTVCSQDNFGRNILHLSCDKPHRLSAFLNYENEANVACALRMVSQDGYTPLIEAMMRGFTRSASLLFIQCKGDQKAWQSPIPILLLAVRENNEDIFRNIFDSGTSSTEFASNSLTPLHHVGAKTSLGFIEYLKSIYPNACNVRIKGKIPLNVYLEQVFNQHDRAQCLSIEVISALYPMNSPENESIVWECFTKDVIHRAMSHQINEENLYTTVITELKRLGCLTSYEAISQRSALSILLESSDDDFQDMYDIWPITNEIACDIINHTSRWPEIQASPLIIRLFKAATKSNDHELVSLLCQKGVSVHQRVKDRSALEVACQQCVRDETFQLLLDHADKKRLDETNPVNNGLGLIHCLAIPSGTRKLTELLQRGVNPNLCTETAPKLSALSYHLGRDLIGSSMILLKNGADPTHPTTEGQVDACLIAALKGATDFLAAIHQTVTSEWSPNWQKRSNINAFLQGRVLVISGCNALHLAAASGQVDCLSFYVDRGIFSDVNMTTDSKYTPLHLAALEGRTDTIKFLNRQGANINARTSTDDLPLHFAVMNKHLNATKVLISLGSDNTMNKLGMSPYMQACQLDEQSFVECFHGSGQEHIPHCSNLTGKDTMDVSSKQKLGLAVALEDAIMIGNPRLCDVLLRKSCQLDVDVPSCSGCSPLLVAIRHRQIDIIEQLLARRASTLKKGCQSHFGLGPIHWILKDKGLTKVIPLFLERYLSDGGDLLSEAASPVYTAVEHDNLEGLQILLEHLQKNAQYYTNKVLGRHLTTAVSGAINQRAYHPMMPSPLHIAARNGFYEIAEYLLENGANPNARTKNLKTPLHEAISSKSHRIQDIAKTLISHNAHIDCRDGLGRTPLMHACINQNWELVKLLLYAHADPNKLDYNMDGLLHLACSSPRRSKIPRVFRNLQILLLDPHHKNNDGVSAIHKAMCCYQDVTLILNGTCGVQRTSPFPWDAFRAVENIPWLESAFTMFRRRIPPDTLRAIANTEPSHGWSPLCMSASEGRLKVMENLLVLGASIEFEGCPDGTALLAACYAGRLESVILLVRRGAVLSYFGPNGFRTAFDKNKTPKRILQWLLVTRYTDQGKIKEAPNDSSFAEPVMLRSWSGVTKAELVISESLERRSEQSSKDYWAFLMEEKKKWRGRVVPIVDRRRTVRPSKLIPLEPVHIHPDGYEIPKATDSSR